MLWHRETQRRSRSYAAISGGHRLSGCERCLDVARMTALSAVLEPRAVAHDVGAVDRDLVLDARVRRTREPVASVSFPASPASDSRAARAPRSLRAWGQVPDSVAGCGPAPAAAAGVVVRSDLPDRRLHPVPSTRPTAPAARVAARRARPRKTRREGRAVDDCADERRFLLQHGLDEVIDRVARHQIGQADASSLSVVGAILGPWVAAPSRDR